MAREVTLTSRVGRFTFDKKIPISKAKLIRDSIVGQVFNRNMGTPKIENEQDAYDYVHHLGRDLEVIPFSFEMDVV